MFSTLEPGRPGQYYFLASAAILEEAENTVDHLLNSLLLKYGEDQFQSTCGSIDGTLPHREQRLLLLPFMLDYIQSLGLDDAEVTSSAEPPVQNKWQRYLVSFEPDQNTWNIPLFGDGDDNVNNQLKEAN